MEHYAGILQRGDEVFGQLPAEHQIEGQKQFVVISKIDFHGCGFSPRFSLGGGSPWCKPPSLDVASLGSGSIRCEAFQTGVYPPASQPTVL
jgi:hypothetical protein